MKDNKFSWNFTIYYGILLSFIQLQYILLTFSFAFGPFKNLPQNFSLFWNGSIFKNFRLGNGKSWKSQYCIYPTQVKHIVTGIQTGAIRMKVMSWMRKSNISGYQCLKKSCALLNSKLECLSLPIFLV